MLDTATLGPALRGATTLRDRVLVVALDREAIEPADRLETIAESIAILRAVDARPIVIFDAGGIGAPEHVATARLGAAIQRHGPRAIPLTGGSVVTVHRLDIPTGPMFMPIVDPALLGQLSALRYIPLVTLPIVDADGRQSDVPPTEIALAAAKFLDAAVLAIVRRGKQPAPEIPPGPDGVRRTRSFALAPSAADRLLSSILFETPPATAKAAAAK